MRILLIHPNYHSGGAEIAGVELAAANLAVDDVMMALQAENIEMPGGRLDRPAKRADSATTRGGHPRRIACPGGSARGCTHTHPRSPAPYRRKRKARRWRSSRPRARTSS